MGRVIIFTGKGGVGKTSIAAAHARKASQEGKKTLIVSTDMAHNLSDLFEIPLGRTETKVAEGLYALEIDPDYEMENDFAFLMDALRNMLPDKYGGASMLEGFEMIPGLEELFSLLKIQELYDKQAYDIIIVDCAPTGETLSLLKFPELLSWYMEKLFPLGKAAVKVMRPVTKAIFKIQLPNGKAMNDIEKLYRKLAGLQELLRNRDICSVRLVTIPEKMVVDETKRNYMYLNLYNFNVDGLYINRILPRDIENSFFEEWLDIQQHFIDELMGVFAEIPVYKVKWYDTDLNGIRSLDRVCEDVLMDPNLFSIKMKIPNEEYEKTKDGYQLRVYVPFAEKKEIALHHSGKDMIIKIGNFKRNIPLPDVLRDYEVQSAKMEGAALVICFTEEVCNE